MDTTERNSSASDGIAYRYRNSKMTIVWHTSVPQDDEAAIAYFHAVTRHGKEINPVFVERVKYVFGKGEVVTVLDTVFDPKTAQTMPYAQFVANFQF